MTADVKTQVRNTAADEFMAMTPIARVRKMLSLWGMTEQFVDSLTIRRAPLEHYVYNANTLGQHGCISVMKTERTRVQQLVTSCRPESPRARWSIKRVMDLIDHFATSGVIPYDVDMAIIGQTQLIEVA